MLRYVLAFNSKGATKKGGTCSLTWASALLIVSIVDLDPGRVWPVKAGIIRSLHGDP